MSWQMSGLKAWLLQRVTAVYIALFMVYFFGSLLFCSPNGYTEWQSWMGSRGMAIGTSLFFLAVIGHAWVGVRDVIIDYVHPFPVRLGALIAVAVGLLAMALWVVRILLTGSV